MSWSDSEHEDTTIYKVVVNHEEQYSIWPADRENALGWNDAGKTGTKEECLGYIKEVWTDMRPLSLRRKMEEAAALSADAIPSSEEDAVQPEDGPDLIQRLSEQGGQPVEVILRPEKSAVALKESIERGNLQLKFMETRGGTELGVRLDPGASDLKQADFENQTGTVHLEGGLTLDYTPVRCIADINLETLAGTGRLQRVEV
jgi:uncharacterized protein YbdZ (MbtH family)